MGGWVGGDTHTYIAGSARRATTGPSGPPVDNCDAKPPKSPVGTQGLPLRESMLLSRFGVIWGYVLSGDVFLYSIVENELPFYGNSFAWNFYSPHSAKSIGFCYVFERRGPVIMPRRGDIFDFLR